MNRQKELLYRATIRYIQLKLTPGVSETYLKMMLRYTIQVMSDFRAIQARHLQAVSEGTRTALSMAVEGQVWYR